MYPFVVKVKYLNDLDFETPATYDHLNLLIYADTFADTFAKAAARIEDRYIDNIESIEVIPCGDSSQLFEVSDKIANALIEGSGDYAEGKKIIQEKE